MQLSEYIISTLAILSLITASIAVFQNNKKNRLAYFRNNFKPMALYIGLLILPPATNYFGNQFNENLLKNINTDWIYTIQLIFSPIVLSFYLIKATNKETHIKVSLFKTFYFLILLTLLLFIPIVFGMNSPAAAAFSFSLNYIYTSITNKWFIGHHFNVPFFKLKSEPFDYLREILCFRSDYATNNPRAIHAYSEALFPLFFIFSLCVLVSQKAMTDVAENKTLLTWNEIIAISDAKTLSDLSTLKSKTAAIETSRAPSSIVINTNKSSLGKDKGDTEAGTQSTEVSFKETSPESQRIFALEEEVKYLKIWIEKITAGTVEHALLAKVIQSRSPASESIGSSVIGVYFFRTIISLVLICLTIAVLQLRSLKSDYINKWTNLNNRIYFILEKSQEKNKLSCPLWRQFAIDLIDTKMWGHKSFKGYFLSIVTPLLEGRPNSVHDLERIKKKLVKNKI